LIRFWSQCKRAILFFAFYFAKDETRPNRRRFHRNFTSFDNKEAYKIPHRITSQNIKESEFCYESLRTKLNDISF
jgi:hypothetical protein